MKRDFIYHLIYALVHSDIDVRGKREFKLPVLHTDAFKSLAIEDLRLSTRAENVVMRNSAISRKFDPIHTASDLMEALDTIEQRRSCGKKTAVEIKMCCLQKWYETLSDEQVVAFWEEFIDLNT